MGLLACLLVRSSVNNVRALFQKPRFWAYGAFCGHIILFGYLAFETEGLLFVLTLSNVLMDDAGLPDKASTTRFAFGWVGSSLCLDITDNKIQTMPWAAILEKVVQLQSLQQLCVVKDLSAHDVVMQLMQKENYLIGMLNKGKQTSDRRRRAFYSSPTTGPLWWVRAEDCRGQKCSVLHLLPCLGQFMLHLQMGLLLQGIQSPADSTSPRPASGSGTLVITGNMRSKLDRASFSNSSANDAGATVREVASRRVEDLRMQEERDLSNLGFEKFELYG
ncbi:hypothetical protein FEM48_Zijuj07G0150100 [Ziziphus jujuba var. spinosa]|uniref:Autophagy-related protein 9 n=1 Tax=Ziziphus jujuba var. spinosa TaxID=714518 RepID=A0A978V5B5_ZIZJJ|nr:hypothetical protein FEM48_Zijuj07G0150100 [Ziziphus jujuba var. spinosa]